MAPNSLITTSPSASPIKLPVATAHFLMDSAPDAGHPTTPVPSWWSKLNFKAVDVLNVSPFIVDPSNTKGDFVLEDQAHNGDSAKRLAWVINTARSANPNIKIIAMQFYGSTAIMNLKTEQQIQNYVATVAKVIEEWTLDGYDIDYEWNSSESGPGNLIPAAPRILHLIRQKLDALSKTVKRPLYVTISPATIACLTTEDTDRAKGNPEAAKYPAKDSVHFVNVQTYSGGDNDYNTLDKWIGLGFTSKQLLFGMLPECTTGGEGTSPTFADAEDAYTKRQLAGINSWRLTGNQAFSNAVQAVIYKFLHPSADIKLPATEKELAAMWETGQGQDKVPF